MRFRNTIPAPIFRTVIFALLGIIIVLWLGWLILGSGSYHWLQQRLLWVGERESKVLGALFSFLLLFIIWLIPTGILRYFSDLTWLGAEDLGTTQASLVAQFQQSSNAQHLKQSGMLSRDHNAPQRSHFYRRMGWAGVGVRLLGFSVTWLAWYLSEQIWSTPLAFGLVGVLGGLLSIFTGKPLMFDWQKTQNLQRIILHIGIVLLILAMLFLAVICVVEAL